MADPTDEELIEKPLADHADADADAGSAFDPYIAWASQPPAAEATPASPPEPTIQPDASASEPSPLQQAFGQTGEPPPQMADAYAPDAVSGGQLPASPTLQQQINKSADQGVEFKTPEERSTDALADFGKLGLPMTPATRQAMFDAIARLPPDQQQAALQRVATQDQTVTQQRRQALASMTPEDRAKAVETMSPEEFTNFQVDHNRAQVLEQARRQSELEQQAQARAQQELAERRAAVEHANMKSQQVVADAQKIANTKIDTGRLNTGYHRFTNILGAALGGAMMQHTGGKNVFLDDYNKRLDRDIAAQKDDIANQWKGIDVRNNAIAQEYQRHGDLIQAETTYRVAAYQHGINELQTDMQQYDPAGTTAMQRRQQIDQLHQQQASALAAYNQQVQKNALDVQKANREAATEAEKVRHNKADEAHANWATGLQAQAQKNETEVMPVDWYVKNYGAENAPATPMTRKQYGELVANKGKISERGEKATDRERKENEYTVYGAPKASIDPKTGKLATDSKNNIVLTPQPIVDPKTGKPWEPPTPKVADDLRTKQEGTTSVIQSIDHLKAIRAKMGWASDISKNPEWQQAQSEFHNIVLQSLKAEGLNRFTEEDAKYLKGVLGDLEDPTRFTGITPGLDTARAIFTRQYNNSLDAAGAPAGAHQTFEDTSTSHPPTPDDVDLAQQQALREPESPVMAQARAAAVSQLAEWAKSDDPKVRDKALERLNDLATDANTPFVKTRAQEILQSGVTPLKDATP